MGFIPIAGFRDTIITVLVVPAVTIIIPFIGYRVAVGIGLAVRYSTVIAYSLCGTGGNAAGMGFGFGGIFAVRTLTGMAVLVGIRPGAPIEMFAVCIVDLVAAGGALSHAGGIIGIEGVFPGLVGRFFFAETAVSEMGSIVKGLPSGHDMTAVRIGFLPAAACAAGLAGIIKAVMILRIHKRIAGQATDGALSFILIFPTTEFHVLLALDLAGAIRADFGFGAGQIISIDAVVCVEIYVTRSTVTIVLAVAIFLPFG